MYHIVAHLQFRKVTDLATFVFFTLAFLTHFTENVRFRDHRKLQHRILIALCHMTISCHNLTRLHFSVLLFTVITAQIIISQILRQTLRPGSGT